MTGSTWKISTAMTPTSKPSIVALIPARAGSKRCPGKNTRRLGGRILLDWTIAAAIESGIFADICVVSDIRDLAHSDDRVRFFSRSPATADDDAPDILWVREFFKHNRGGDAFAILRPTSPFRTAETIRRAWEFFQEHQPSDSLRAVRFVTEHPAKMWNLTLGSRMTPLLGFHHLRDPLVPWHSSPTQSIPIPLPVIQTGGLEIAWTRTVTEQQSIAGSSVLSYFVPEREQLDINTPDDWERAEHLMATQPLEYLG